MWKNVLNNFYVTSVLGNCLNIKSKQGYWKKLAVKAFFVEESVRFTKVKRCFWCYFVFGELQLGVPRNCTQRIFERKSLPSLEFGRVRCLQNLFAA